MKTRLLLTLSKFSSFDVLPAEFPSYTQAKHSSSCFRNCDDTISDFFRKKFLFIKTATIFLYMFLIQAKRGPGDGQFLLTIRPRSINLTKKFLIYECDKPKKHQQLLSSIFYLHIIIAY
jgi:hypothetical protein